MTLNPKDIRHTTFNLSGCCEQARARCPGQGRGRLRGHDAAAGDGQGEEAAGDEADQGEDMMAIHLSLES